MKTSMLHYIDKVITLSFAFSTFSDFNLLFKLIYDYNKNIIIIIQLYLKTNGF